MSQTVRAHTVQNQDDSPRDRVMNAAEALFMLRGFAAVTLRDIAAEVGIKHTSLYHHVPGGKEELFVEVFKRSVARHEAGMRHALRDADPDIRSQLHAISDWFLGQSPMDLVRMTRSDIPALSSDAASELEQLTYESILKPLEAVLRQAHARGEIITSDFALVAGGILGMIQSLFSVPDYAVRPSREQMGRDLVDAFLNGIAA
jgi:AcrR family transcriptional regulator